MARTRPGQQQQPASASVTTSQQPPAQLSDVTSSHWDMSTSSRRSLAPQETISLSPGDPLRDLFEACKHGDVSRVRTLVTPHNVNARDTAGRKSSPLHFAAGSNTNTRSWIAQQHSTAPPPRIMTGYWQHLMIRYGYANCYGMYPLAKIYGIK